MTTRGPPYPAAGSPTATTVTPTSETFPPHFLSSGSRRSSPVTKTYHQSSTLFLTRRLPEALTTLQPLITPRRAPDGGVLEPAPVARASRTTRIKVWSLYLTILNAIVEMEPDEGKDAFGVQEWRALCGKVRDGGVWEQVVQNGYHGVEGDVDADVVINLATILLAHAKNQLLNQQRLEAYLATCNTPNLDVAGRLPGKDGTKASHRYMSPARSAVSGAATPRDLNARVKILELYTLHVLLRNDEWEYAREFITVSSVLDEERREAFLQALESLQEEEQEARRREAEERERKAEELRKSAEEARRAREEAEKAERRRKEVEKQGGSEVDYGIEDAPIRGTKDPGKSALSRSGRKAPAGPPSLGERAAGLARGFQAAIDRFGAALRTNPVLLVRVVAFVLGLVLVLSRQGVRERIRRIVAGGWGKVKATAGMGVRVSYI